MLGVVWEQSAVSGEGKWGDEPSKGGNDQKNPQEGCPGKRQTAAAVGVAKGPWSVVLFKDALVPDRTESSKTRQAADRLIRTRQTNS